MSQSVSKDLPAAAPEALSERASENRQIAAWHSDEAWVPFLVQIQPRLESGSRPAAAGRGRLAADTVVAAGDEHGGSP